MINDSDRKIVPVQNSNSPTLDRADIVIIGNGIAGLTAAIEARRLAPEKRIVIVTDQIHPTINTPALKQFAVGKLTREQLLAYPAGTERLERIHIVTSRVSEIHAQSKYITLSGNRGFGYDSLLIATGSTPQGLPERTPGRNFDGVLTLHRLQDYLDLRRRLGEINEAAVIGGGVHAIETVMGLLYWGIRTHWLIRGKTFMGRILDEQASEIVLNNVRRAGAVIHLETEVTGIIGRVGAVAGVITNHQEMIPCQLVLSCTGTQAATKLAQTCTVPMMHKNGIMVDDKLRTSVRDIYAAGDVAALKNPQTGSYEPRAQWYAAVAQGRIAGSMMVGHKELAQQPFGVQWHATHLGELSMLTVGEPISKDPRVTTLTDTSQGGYRRITMLDDLLVGYLSLGNTQPDSLAIKRLIDEGVSIRNVIKPLLKGQFDSRSYLSHQRSRATRNLLEQKLPMLMRREEVETPGLLPNTDEFFSFPEPQQVNPRATRQLPPPSQQPQIDPLQQRRVVEQPARMPAAAMPALPIHNEDEINPFTGNLPDVAMTHTDDLVSLPQVTDALSLMRQTRQLVEEPFTPPQGHQLSKINRRPEAALNPSEKKPLNYKLWAYIDQSQDID
ncbi:NAD(P)/FAD-dependent oxidoreductase [Dictyobacter kobayashii]|uniref:FAD/NAD(P)-binding domain-containing protein n=1 Tax=Dictyobacter kobayashii TaxID=2014872 RepID=A0A402AIE3_9CHLR|nr:FAD/NAD(P)-binding oxidoreductase [Dictyobacter kobayashii]GCE18833.1 hypothetical protein KDK_26330 [Dictyobacter kobayashii]